jgi:hypothetical protein
LAATLTHAPKSHDPARPEIRQGYLEKIRIKGKACRLLDKKLRAWHEESTSGLNAVHRHLLRWVRSVRIGRYAPKALDPTLESYPMDRVHHDNIAGLSRSAPSLAIPLTKRNYGRVHTPISYGWKGFRNFLTIDGAHLVGIDLRNSQPLLFGLVLKALQHNGGQIPAWLTPATEERDVGYLHLPLMHTANSADDGRNSTDESTNASTIPSTTAPTGNGGQRERDANPFIMTKLFGYNTDIRLTEVPVEQGNCDIILADVDLRGNDLRGNLFASSEEVRRYVELCEAGRFYDLLLARLDNPSVDRSEFKVRMFRNVFFGRDQNSKHTPEWRLFAAEFPTIAGLIQELKRRYSHSAVAWVLMRIESSLIIDRICRRLMDEAPNVPVITIHDMILTTRKNRCHVEQIVREEYAQVGLRPKLNIEDYGQMAPPKRTPKQKRKRRSRHDPERAA